MSSKFEPGDNIELVHTNDAFTKLVPGCKGVVRRVMDTYLGEQIDIEWEDGSNLSMVPDSGDRIRKVAE
jgi:hypothetical protein